jgi:hypothetical protein
MPVRGRCGIRGEGCAPFDWANESARAVGAPTARRFVPHGSDWGTGEFYVSMDGLYPERAIRGNQADHLHSLL